MSLKAGHASFDELIVSSNNEKAFTAAKEMAMRFPAPGVLLMYGPSGSGKTALLRAEREEISKWHPEHQMLWASSAQYMGELVSAIRAKATDAFYKKFVGINLLIVDNLEDFCGKSATQGDLAAIIARAYSSGAQVFLAANHHCKPLRIEMLLQGSISNLTVVDLGLPDQNTLERAWIHFGQVHNLPISSDYVEFFCKSNVKNYWALNGLLQSYLYTHQH